MAKKKFERTKPHVNIGTIGHIDHGKTTLTSAITRCLANKGKARVGPLRSDRKAPEEKDRGITIATAHVEYETDEAPLRPRRLSGPRRLHQEHDHRRGPDGRSDPGSGCEDGPMPQTREHILLARQVGVPCIVVYLNKVDMVDDPELIDLVELELRELLTAYEFPGDKIPIIKGSALKAWRRRRQTGLPPLKEHIRLSMPATPTYPSPQRYDKPFLMPIEDVFSITGRGTVGTGRVERGRDKAGRRGRDNRHQAHPEDCRHMR